MAYIRVDYSKFEVTASAIDTYVEKHKSNMSNANGEVNTLADGWNGDDFTQFQNQWNRVTEDGSTSQKMIGAMGNYAEFLRYAANKYKEAQINAVNRANSIPKWLWD